MMLTRKHRNDSLHVITITISDQEIQHLTQAERFTLMRTRVLLADFDLDQPIRYEYSPELGTTTISQTMKAKP